MTTMPIGRAVGWLADQDPDRPAITHEGRTISRRELDRSTNVLARAYWELGVQPDSMVTIALPNGIEFYQATLAVWKLGATPQPVSARLPLLERQAIVDLAQPSLIVGVEPGEHGDRPSIPAGFEPDPDLADGPLDDRIATYWKAPTSGGSTGRPKLIVAAEPGVVDPEAPALSMTPGGVQLVPGPLYHNGPFLFSTRGLLMGHHLVVLSRFDAARVLAEIERWRVTWMLMVPTMMHRIWRLPPKSATGTTFRHSRPSSTWAPPARPGSRRRGSVGSAQSASTSCTPARKARASPGSPARNGSSTRVRWDGRWAGAR